MSLAQFLEPVSTTGPWTKGAGPFRVKAPLSREYLRDTLLPKKVVGYLRASSLNSLREHAQDPKGGNYVESKAKHTTKPFPEGSFLVFTSPVDLTWGSTDKNGKVATPTPAKSANWMEPLKPKGPPPLVLGDFLGESGTWDYIGKSYPKYTVKRCFWAQMVVKAGFPVINPSAEYEPGQVFYSYVPLNLKTVVVIEKRPVQKPVVYDPPAEKTFDKDQCQNCGRDLNLKSMFGVCKLTDGKFYCAMCRDNVQKKLNEKPSSEGAMDIGSLLDLYLPSEAGFKAPVIHRPTPAPYIPAVLAPEEPQPELSRWDLLELN